jgi:transposase-like protein
MAKRKKYSEVTKGAAVARVRGGETASAVAADLGATCTASLVRRWVKKANGRNGGARGYSKYPIPQQQELAARIHNGETLAALNRETKIDKVTLRKFRERHPAETVVHVKLREQPQPAAPPAQPPAPAAKPPGWDLPLPGKPPTIEDALAQIRQAAETLALVREAYRTVFGS